ncbi:MAG: ribosome maturation factor RimM [Bosea sp. (in: a-proteobacteria)]
MAIDPDLVLVGRFGRPHGIKGELRLQSFTQDPLAIADYGPLSSADGRKTFTLEWVRPQGDMLVVRVKGVASREAAEALTNLELHIPRTRLPQADDEDEVLAADLVGCSVVDQAGTTLGTVTDIANYGAGDLLDIKCPDGRSVLMPFTKAFPPEIDLKARRIVADPPGGLFDDDGAVEEAPPATAPRRTKAGPKSRRPIDPK